MNDEKESLYRNLKDEAFVIPPPPPGQSFGSGTFFNKEITSKNIPIRYFEFNYIFTKRDCYVVNL